MDRAVSLAPSVRIRRRTGWQRRYLPRALASAGRLAACSRLADEEAARRELARRLGPLRSALLRSPHYVERLRADGLSPRDLRGLDDLSHFPTLDRETLRERWQDLPAFDPQGRVAREMVAVQSSGSTGQPVTVLKDAYDCLHMWAVLRFWAGWLPVALPPRPRVTLLCSLANGIEYSVRLPLLDGGALHRISLVRSHPLKKLQRARPAVVFSDPAGLHWLAAQERPPCPCLILTSAQYFSPHQRRALAAAVPAPVINYYASSDAGPIAWECPDALGRFHVLFPDVWVESVAGELVVTRLRHSVLPLLRYRTGDRGVVEREACPCGYHGWSILNFTGRRECAFVTPGGGRADAWQLAWLFKHYPLRGFRLTQRTLESFDLELAEQEAGTLDAADLAQRLRASLVRLGWPRPKVALRRVPAVGSTGEKPEPFRSVVPAASAG